MASLASFPGLDQAHSVASNWDRRPPSGVGILGLAWTRLHSWRRSRSWGWTRLPGLRGARWADVPGAKGTRVALASAAACRCDLERRRWHRRGPVGACLGTRP